MDWLNFEIYIRDLIIRQEILTAEDLSEFAEELHNHVEMVIQDYAMVVPEEKKDEGIIDDYESVF